MVANEMLTFGELLIVVRAKREEEGETSGIYGEVIFRFSSCVLYIVDYGARVPVGLRR